MRECLVLLGRHPSGLLDLNERATPTSTVTGKPYHLRPVPQSEVPRNGRGNHDIVAGR